MNSGRPPGTPGRTDPATLHGFLLAAAEHGPDRPAVVERSGSGLRTVTYRELEELTGRYAASLDALGVGVADRVMVEAETSASSIAMILACSTLGATFIPMSPETPDKRLLAVISTAEPVLHLQAGAGTREGIPPEVGTGRFGPDGLDVERAPRTRVRRRRAVVPTDPAYIVFTSGTTGRPKGVVMTHRAILAFYRGLLAHGVADRDSRVATTSPFHFDFALLDIGLALANAATVVPVPRAYLWQPRRFVEFLAETGATQVNGVPSIWGPVLHHASAELGRLGRLRGVLYSGEAFPLPELRRLQEALPQARVVNCFGSTESVACCFSDVPRPIPADTTELPIGTAHAGAALVLVDDRGEAVTEPGRVGEIYLHSAALFSCYWDDPDTTARTLVPDPLDPRSGQLVYRSGDLGRWGQDGLMYFCGRADNLVKIRGNRVELGDVERALLALPQVGAAAVLALPVRDQELGLFAFLTPAAGTEPVAESAVRAFCQETLPPYMVPYRFHVLPEFPVTANGKTDRRALAEQVAHVHA